MDTNRSAVYVSALRNLSPPAVRTANDAFNKVASTHGKVKKKAANRLWSSYSRINSSFSHPNQSSKPKNKKQRFRMNGSNQKSLVSQPNNLSNSPSVASDEDSDINIYKVDTTALLLEEVGQQYRRNVSIGGVNDNAIKQAAKVNAARQQKVRGSPQRNAQPRPAAAKSAPTDSLQSISISKYTQQKHQNKKERPMDRGAQMGRAIRQGNQSGGHSYVKKVDKPVSRWTKREDHSHRKAQKSIGAVKKSSYFSRPTAKNPSKERRCSPRNATRLSQTKKPLSRKAKMKGSTNEDAIEISDDETDCSAKSNESSNGKNNSMQVDNSGLIPKKQIPGKPSGFQLLSAPKAPPEYAKKRKKPALTEPCTFHSDKAFIGHYFIKDIHTNPLKVEVRRDYVSLTRMEHQSSRPLIIRADDMEVSPTMAHCISPLLICSAKKGGSEFYGLRFEIRTNSDSSTELERFLMKKGLDPDKFFDPKHDDEMMRCVYIYANEEWASQCKSVINSVRSRSSFKGSKMLYKIEQGVVLQNMAETDGKVFAAWDKKMRRLSSSAGSRPSMFATSSLSVAPTSATKRNSSSIQREPSRRSKRIRTRSGRLTRGGEAKVLFQYPFPPKRSRLEITDWDKERIQDDFLNDSLVDFFIQKIQEKITSSSPQLMNSFYLFNTFFFTRLKQGYGFKRQGTKSEKIATAHASVASWIRKANLNIFEKQFLVMPINGNLHWSVMIICHPSLFRDYCNRALQEAYDAKRNRNANIADGSLNTAPEVCAGSNSTVASVDLSKNDEDENLKCPMFCMLHLDSLHLHRTGTIKTTLMRFLYQEWVQSFRANISTEGDSSKSSAGIPDTTNVSWKNLVPEEVSALCSYKDIICRNNPFSSDFAVKIKVPQQTNSIDCGLYTCHYIDRFVKTIEDLEKRKQSTSITHSMVRAREWSWLGPNFLGEDSGTSMLGKQYRRDLMNIVTQAHKDYEKICRELEEKKKEDEEKNKDAEHHDGKNKKTEDCGAGGRKNNQGLEESCKEDVAESNGMRNIDQKSTDAGSVEKNVENHSDSDDYQIAIDSPRSVEE